ncbi:MAG: translocation protein TolB [Bacteroidota bacterium]
MSKVIKLIVLLVLLAPVTSFAQQMTLEKFGRNRIQYKEFKWRFLSSDNFDVYFYAGGNKIAKEVIEYLEDEFDRVTDMIDYPPYSKTKVFLYNSVADLQQSNVGINDGTFTPSGETQFVKPYIEIANPGSIDALKKELIYKVSSLMVNEMLFGGNLKDMFQSSILLNLPAWFINGASLYVANGWDEEMDDYIRDYINKKRPQKLSRLTGREAALAGQSVWNFIAQRYGESNIGNILNYTRIIRNEEESITIIIGTSFEQFTYEWQRYYSEIDEQVNQNYQALSEEQLIVTDNKHLNYRNLSLSPDGTKLAYTVNNNGRFTVKLRELESGKETDILKGGYKVINQEVDNNMPLIDWADENTLGIIHAKRGALSLTLYDQATNSKLPRKLRRFDQIKSMDFSDNGRLIIVSGVVNGKNDLFLLSSRRDRVKRLTDDLYDDLYPSFVPGTNSFVFSSNRTSDSLSVKTNDFEALGKNMNLFIYNLDTTKLLLRRVTNTVSHDTRPLALNADVIYYVSDQKGVNNLFKYALSSGIYTQVTNYRQSVKNFDLDFTNGALAFISTNTGRDQIYYSKDFNYNQQIFTPITPRQQMLQAKAFRERRKSQPTGLTIQDIVEQRLAEKEKKQEEEIAEVDTTIVNDPEVIDTDNYQFEDDVEVPKEEVINTDDYTFDNDLVKPQQESFLTQYRQLRKENKIVGPLNYEERFSADNIITSFVIDPLRGFGILLETQMTDMLENHRFSGGVMAITDLRSGDVWAEYQYLKGRIDIGARLERNVLEWEANGIEVQQYSKNTVMLGASLPLNTKTRFSVNPFYTLTSFESQPFIAGPNPVLPDGATNHFGGVNLELVYDNSIINGMNLIEGTRAKISLRHYEGLNDKENSFSNFKADLRHYQKIHREIVLATRFFYGSFFGRDPKNYLLGGMDNWINQDDNLDGEDNPLAPTEGVGVDNSELLFTEFATNVRGFDYASLVGNNALVFNAELRIPLIRYLQAGPITSNFFRNLQFTGFFDIGSAWTGKSPFNDDNSISNQVIREGAFVIDLKNYRNPWLYSYGFGFRTMLLGYYVKLDVAYPIENYNVGDTAFHFTLGYDF